MRETLLGVGVEEVEHEGHELGLGEDLEDGDEGGSGVVERAGMAAGPVEELEAGEHVLPGLAVVQNVQHEGFGQAEAQLRQG